MKSDCFFVCFRVDASDRDDVKNKIATRYVRTVGLKQ